MESIKNKHSFFEDYGSTYKDGDKNGSGDGSGDGSGYGFGYGFGSGDGTWRTISINLREISWHKKICFLKE